MEKHSIVQQQLVQAQVYGIKTIHMYAWETGLGTAKQRTAATQRATTTADRGAWSSQ